MPIYSILLYRIIFLIFSRYPSKLLELFSRDGLTALLAAILALFIPVAILVIERSRKDDETFPWEEEMTILQISHPKMLFIAIIGASLSCILWNEVVAKFHMLPIVLNLYITCIVIICWILCELYRWLLSIVSKKKTNESFRLEKITEYFNSIKTGDDRIRVWLMTLDKIQLAIPTEQSWLIELYLQALNQHTSQYDYHILVQCFTDNILKLNISEINRVFEYSLSSITSNQTDPNQIKMVHQAMDKKLFLSALNTIKDGNVLLMETAYGVIQKCKDDEQSCAMTKCLASNFFTMLTQEEYEIQNTIIDNFGVCYKWDFCQLVTDQCDKKLYKQIAIWLSQYTLWLVEQYLKQFSPKDEIDKYHVRKIIGKVSEQLFRGCHIDLRMFADIALFYCPVDFTRQCNESDASVYVHTFLEKTPYRNFMNFELPNSNSTQAKLNAAKLLLLVAPITDEDLKTYVSTIDFYTDNINNQKGNSDRDIAALLRLKEYFEYIKKAKDQEKFNR